MGALGWAQEGTQTKDPYIEDYYYYYCDYPEYRNTLACAGSHPGYCRYEEYRNSLACVGSHPGYCRYEEYRHAYSCAGSNPYYCADGYYSNSAACLDTHLIEYSFCIADSLVRVGGDGRVVQYRPFASHLCY